MAKVLGVDRHAAMPADADFAIEGLLYKKGVHGFVFYWAGEHGWLRSSKHQNDLKNCFKLGGDNSL